MTEYIAKVTSQMDALLRSLSVTYRAGHEVHGHQHDWGQLVFAVDGAIDVLAEQEAWLIPPTRAVLVPPMVPHSLRFRRRTALRTVYLPPSSCRNLSDKCVGLSVSGLLKELILETCRLGVMMKEEGRHTLVSTLLIEEISRASRLPFVLTLPKDRRARHAALQIWVEPGSLWTLNQLADQAGASSRTLQRLFLSETGLTFGHWLQLARLFAASNALLDGQSVTEAALSAGYSSTSAFIAAFRKEAGMTPLQYKRLQPSHESASAAPV